MQSLYVFRDTIFTLPELQCRLSCHFNQLELKATIWDIEYQCPLVMTQGQHFLSSFSFMTLGYCAVPSETGSRSCHAESLKVHSSLPGCGADFSVSSVYVAMCLFFGSLLVSFYWSPPECATITFTCFHVPLDQFFLFKPSCFLALVHSKHSVSRIYQDFVCLYCYSGF